MNLSHSNIHIVYLHRMYAIEADNGTPQKGKGEQGDSP